LVKHGQSANDQANEPFGLLTVLTGQHCMIIHERLRYTLVKQISRNRFSAQHRVLIRDKLFLHIHDPVIVTTLLITRHRRRCPFIVDRGIDCTEHDLDDKICAEGRFCLTEGDRIHHVTDAVGRPKLVI